jgi:hypothetical protein
MKLSYILLPFLVSACASQATEEAVSPVNAKQALVEAIELNKKADELGYEWRDTGQWIKDAEAALAAGKDAEALKLANKVKAAAEDGIQQAADQKNAGPLF